MAGNYKLNVNFVGGTITTSPNKVTSEMKKILNKYYLKEVTVEDIIEFLHDFEVIHPFQDGNVRVGRLILLKLFKIDFD